LDVQPNFLVACVSNASFLMACVSKSPMADVRHLAAKIVGGLGSRNTDWQRRIQRRGRGGRRVSHRRWRVAVVSGIWSTADGPAVRPAGRIAHGRQCSGGQLATGSGPLDAVRRRRSSRGLGLAHRRSPASNRLQPATTLAWPASSQGGGASEDRRSREQAACARLDLVKLLMAPALPDGVPARRKATTRQRRPWRTASAAALCCARRRGARQRGRKRGG
jgi:hypothetical protein